MAAADAVAGAGTTGVVGGVAEAEAEVDIKTAFVCRARASRGRNCVAAVVGGRDGDCGEGSGWPSRPSARFSEPGCLLWPGAASAGAGGGGRCRRSVAGGAARVQAAQKMAGTVKAPAIFQLSHIAAARWRARVRPVGCSLWPRVQNRQTAGAGGTVWTSAPGGTAHPQTRGDPSAR